MILHNKLTRAVALLAALMLALLTACSIGGDDAGNGSAGDGAQATGRYLETQYPLPAEIGYVMLLDQAANGDLVLFASRTPDESGAPWGLWRSADLGATWTAEHPGWLDELAEMSLMIVSPASDGGFYIFYTVPESAEFEENPESTADAPSAIIAETPDGESGAEELDEDDTPMIISDEDMEDWLANYVPPEAHFVHAKDDVVTEMPFLLPTNAYGYTGDSATLADNGDLLMLDGYSLEQLDPDTGDTKHSFEPGSYLAPGYVSSAHGRLALFERDNIGLYDLGSGERIGEIALADGDGSDGETAIRTNEYIGHQALAFDPDDPDAVYFALDSGLYRAVIDSPVVERLIDGELTSLNMPSYSIQGLFPQADGSFLVRCSGSEPVLLHFVYDPDVPATPSTELRIYSLEDNRSIRQYMGMYQLQNPDVKIRYTVGVPEDSAITASDAVRTLNTELLGGTGPDILVLDGLPVDSYIRQGALADLQDFYTERSGDLLDNVAGAWRQADGEIHAIPTRFTVPSLLAPAAAAETGNIAELVAWAESVNTFSLFTGSGGKLLTALYPLLSESWFDAQGALDREAFAASLELIDRLIAAVEDSGGSFMDFGDEDYVPGSMFDAVFYANGTLSMGVEEIASLDELEQIYSALQVRDGSLRPMPTLDGRQVFVPGSVLAVNSATAHEALALDFLALALGAEGQGYDLSNGLPVHRAALLAQTENPYNGEASGGYTIGFSTAVSDDEEDPDAEPEVGFSGALNIKWPDDAFFEEYLDYLEALEPVQLDAVIRQIVLEEVGAYFAGSASLDDTVSGLSSKVDLYLSERR